MQHSNGKTGRRGVSGESGNSWYAGSGGQISTPLLPFVECNSIPAASVRSYVIYI